MGLKVDVVVSQKPGEETFKEFKDEIVKPKSP